jgi:hypothetical protein
MSQKPQSAPLSLPGGKPRRAETPAPRSGKSERQQPRTVRLTVSLPSDLVDRLRDAVYWSPDLKLAWLIAQSLRASLADLETSRQSPFPKRVMALRSGRPRLIGQSMKVPTPTKLPDNGAGHQAKAPTQAGLTSQPSIE